MSKQTKIIIYKKINLKFEELLSSKPPKNIYR